MKYKIIEMDGRYSKYGYQYLVEFSKGSSQGTGVLDFDRCRRWFNTNFGWSQDVETRQKMMTNYRSNKEAYAPDDFNTIWAYSVKYGDYRIYVADEKTLSWFAMVHPST